MAADVGVNKLQARSRAALRPVANKLWTIERSGFDRLPTEGPAILCPNHVSFIDSVFLMLSLPRNISFVGKAEYMDSWKTKFAFPAMGMIPIDRTGGDKSKGALDVAQAVLERGELFGIYPEGTRSRDGRLYKGRTGAARLAIATGAPIYPVGIVGTDDVQPVNARMPKIRTSCSITIGRPIRPERYVGRGPEHLAWRSMIDEVMFEIREMTGQTYVNAYAGSTDDHKPSKVATVDVADEQPAERELAYSSR
ncbi:MAG TPA: lysophospholipid acyltransferase family protein [Ilumatobacter sp.]|nr:lysophospholipid acyltransferase family protein [Ilumatobacter sp.]